MAAVPWSARGQTNDAEAERQNREFREMLPPPPSCWQIPPLPQPPSPRPKTAGGSLCARPQGGALTLAMVLRAKQLGLPIPGAIAPGTPMSDVTKRVGRQYDLVSRDGFCDAGTKVYAGAHDMKDPLISPVYGDMSGPTILTSSTRDLLLSNTLRVRRKLRQAGVEAILQVYQGQSHAHFLRDDSAPETREIFAEISPFFNKHMRK